MDRERRASGVSCRAGRYFWHTIKLDDRVCASAPWDRYLRALGRLNHRRRAKFILEKNPNWEGRNLVGHTMVLCVHINIIKIIRRPWPSPAWVTNSRSRKERVRVLVEIKPEMLERDSVVRLAQPFHWQVVWTSEPGPRACYFKFT